MHVAPEYHSAVRRQERVNRLARPIQIFMATETAGGIALVIATILALAWANSPWSDSYQDLLHAHLAIDLGFWSLDRTVHFWINDAAMVVFFFVVGLEIKREAVAGELADPRRIALPIAAALGGMVMPALIFFAIAGSSDGSGGWGIPIATDIAFAIGVLTLVGSRVPFGLRVMLLALAIVDDIGGIIVIAVFYTSELQVAALGLAAGTLALAYVFRQSGIWYLPVYIAIGVVGWAAAVESGVHPTIIGVAFGLLAPWRAWYDASGLEDMVAAQVDRFREAENLHDENEAHEERVTAVLNLRRLTAHAVSPLDRLERDLQPLVAFVIVPIFAFTNAGVSVSGETLADAVTAPVALGVFFGLLIGKPIGILLATFIAVRVGAKLPTGVTWAGIMGVGLLGGIGFTVSLLITDLSFTDEVLLTDAKLGILFASLLAGILGFTVLRLVYGGAAPIAEPESGPPPVSLEEHAERRQRAGRAVAEAVPGRDRQRGDGGGST